jgi:uncharacterized protein (TIGR02452 family)
MNNTTDYIKNNLKDYLISVYKNTINYCSYIYNINDTIIDNENNIYDINQSTETYINKTYINKSIDNINKIIIYNDDVLDIAILYKNKNYNPLILNMANEWFPGGGVSYGIISQEEDIFRRTNIHLYLLNKYYPIENKSIYTKNVNIIKDKNYNILKKFINLSFITASAIPTPILNNKYELCNNDKDKLYNKIRNLFIVTEQNNHDCIILGAWGCGSYHNPPVDVALCFKKIINEKDWNIKNFIFAINDNYNYNIFNTILLNL